MAERAIKQHVLSCDEILHLDVTSRTQRADRAEQHLTRIRAHQGACVVGPAKTRGMPEVVQRGSWNAPMPPRCRR